MIHAEHPAEGSFHSSDHTLNRVFTLLRDSALLGVQEQFVDTPTREKGQFLGDAANISYATMALFGERHFTAKALREFAGSANATGIRHKSEGATTLSIPTATASATSLISRS